MIVCFASTEGDVFWLIQLWHGLGDLVRLAGELAGFSRLISERSTFKAGGENKGFYALELGQALYGRLD